MIPYIFVYLSALLLSFFNKTIYGGFFKFIIYIILVLFISFRSISVGTDTKVYLEIFNNINVTDVFRFDLEPLFVSLVLLSKTLYNDFSFYLFLFSTLFVFFWSRIFYRLKSDYTVALVSFLSFFVFFGFFNISRQYFAVSICLYSLFFLFEKKYKTFFLLVVAASLFHFPALFFLSVFCLRYFKSHHVLFFLSFVFSFLFIDLSINFLADYNLKNSYSAYGDKLDTVSGFFIILFFLLQYLFFSFIKYFFLPEDRWYAFLLNIFSLGLGFFLACKSLKVLDEGPTRLAFYFLTVNIFLFAISVNSIRDSRIRILFKYFMIVFSFIFYFNFLYSGSGELFPYVLDYKFRIF